MNACMFIRFCSGLFMLIVSVFLTGCLESSFELAAESRLPKWLDVPDGLSRSELKVTMDYYSTFGGGEYVFKFYKKDNFFKSQKVTVDISRVKKIPLKDAPQGPKDYPKYYAVTINGVVDIFEHKKMESVFYMSDDPAVWKELGAEQK